MYVERRAFFIDGAWTASPEAEETVIVNPATLEEVGVAALGSERDAEAAVRAARGAFDSGVWAQTPPAERAAVMRRAADHLESRLDELAEMLTAELGCPLWFSKAAHVPNPIKQLRYYADLTEGYEFEQTRSDGVNRSIVRREPVGVVAAVTPWNGPMSTPMIKVAPAIGTGSSIVLKPSSNTPLSVYAIAEAFEAAGLPPGVLNIVPTGRGLGEYLIRHPQVDKVAFTGSTEVGKRIMGICADRIARVSLELGGKSAAIVLEDADVEQFVRAILPMTMLVNGQACIAQTRVLVPRRREAAFADALGAALAAQRVGDPMADDTQIGPMVNRKQQENVRGYIDTGRAEGARLVAGGGVPSLAEHLERGWFVEPTLFAGVDNGMRIAQEEIFGPVVAMIPYDDEDEAVRIANDSIYGLSGSVFSADPERALAVARRVRTGMVSINGSPQALGSPFGGYKQSGIGREMGPEGFSLYLETKSIAVGPA